MFTFSNAVLPSTQSISSSTAATLSFQLIPPPTGGSSSRRSAPKKAKPGSPMSVPLPQPSVPEQPPSQPPSLQAHSPVSVQSPDTSEVSQGIPTPALIPPVPVTPSQPVANLSQAAANSSVAANSTQPSVGLPQRTINPSQLLAPPQVAVEPSRSTPEPPKTPSEATATRPASGPAPIPPQAVTPSQLVANPSQTPANSSQVAANPSQPLASPQVAVEPSRSILKPPMISTEAIAIQPASGLAPITPQVITNAADVTTTPPAPGAQYRARVKETTASSRSSRRDSIDGAPTIADFEIPSHQDSSDDDTPEVIVDLSEYLNITSDTEDGSHVSSSQKSSDGCQGLLSLPPSSQWRHSSSGREEETASCSQSPPAQDNPLLDTEDLPSWMTKKGQWKYVVSTAGGPDWKKLLEVYLEQERRLEFRDMVGNSLVPSVSLFLVVHRAQLLRTRAGHQRSKNTSSMLTNPRGAMVSQFLILVEKWPGGGKPFNQSGVVLRRTHPRAERVGRTSSLVDPREFSWWSCVWPGGIGRTRVTWMRKRVRVRLRLKLPAQLGTPVTPRITMLNGWKSSGMSRL